MVCNVIRKRWWCGIRPSSAILPSGVLRDIQTLNFGVTLCGPMISRALRHIDVPNLIRHVHSVSTLKSVSTLSIHNTIHKIYIYSNFKRALGCYSFEGISKFLISTEICLGLPETIWTFTRCRPPGRDFGSSSLGL